MDLRRVQIRTDNRNIYDRCRRLLREFDEASVHLIHHQWYDFNQHVFDVTFDADDPVFASFLSGVVYNSDIAVTINETVKNKHNHVHLREVHGNSIREIIEKEGKTQDGINAEQLVDLRARVSGLANFDSNVEIGETKFNELNDIFNSLNSKLNLVYRYMHEKKIDNTPENVVETNKLSIEDLVVVN